MSARRRRESRPLLLTITSTVTRQSAFPPTNATARRTTGGVTVDNPRQDEAKTDSRAVSRPTQPTQTVSWWGAPPSPASSAAHTRPREKTEHAPFLVGNAPDPSSQPISLPHFSTTTTTDRRNAP